MEQETFHLFLWVMSGMEQETFHLFLWVMSGIALLVFIALYFVKAGYGIFRTPSWGWSINNKTAWVLMESPVFIVMLALWACSGVGVALPFPFLMKGKSKMPVAIMAMGIVFNVLNGMMQAGGLFYFNGNVPTGIGWSYLSEPHALIGLLLF